MTENRANEISVCLAVLVFFVVVVGLSLPGCPRPDPATLTVDTEPVKGEVIVEGESWGIAPQQRQVKPGAYVVAFGAVAGHKTPASKSVVVSEGDDITLTGTYVKVPPPPESAIVVILYESNDVDDKYPWFVNIQLSQRIRALESADLDLMFADKNEMDEDGNPHPVTKRWADHAEQNDLALPHVFFVDKEGELVHNERSPRTVDGMVALIEGYLP